MAELSGGQDLYLAQAQAAAQSLTPLPVHDELVQHLYQEAQEIAAQVVKKKADSGANWQERLDDLVTSRWLGFPLMLLLLALVFWLTLVGANQVSEMLAALLFGWEETLTSLLVGAATPAWLQGLIVAGMYRTTTWVVAVMLPPMAIFFPLFTLLEDLGYLPRVAFNLDRLFRWAGAHGKQALTMSMGFGCNAAGVIGCRIIESPRERLIAILTNNFVPCNGRLPILITLSTLFLGSAVFFPDASLGAAMSVISLILLGVAATLLVSWLLSRTLLKGIPSAFVLELPPYRPPQVGRILVRSVFDRTIFVLGRAVTMAAPAGALTWLLANTVTSGGSLLAQAAAWLEPAARLLGLDSVILLAFFLGLPANEIVLPIIVMSYLEEGALIYPSSLSALHSLLTAHGWHAGTALAVMLFSLLHFPCSTTLWTIYRETKSLRWTAVAFFLPLSVASLVLLSLNSVLRLVF